MLLPSGAPLTSKHQAGRAPHKIKKEKKPRDNVIYQNQLMIPEFMMEIPQDLNTCWFIVPIPQGERCFVVSSRRSTISRRMDGSIIQRFSSTLPSGSQKQHYKEEYCILDCIFSPELKTYFVLDLMCWKGYSLYDCGADFRFYWLFTKLEETTANRFSSDNPFVFLPLPRFDANQTGVRSALQFNISSNPPTPSNAFYF